MKASARSQKVRVVTESDYIEFMKCPMKAHDSLIAERLFHDIPSCSPPTRTNKASALPPPGPPPGPVAPSITSWSAPVKICKPGQTQAHDAIFQDICSPPTKICKAGKDLGPGEGTTNVVTGFNIEQSFRRLSCEEKDDSNDNKIKENNECLDIVKQTQKENINTKNSNFNENLSKKKNKDPSTIQHVFSNKSENIKNNKNENPWITVKGKTGPFSQTRAKTNKENKSINPMALQSKLNKQLSEGIKSKSESKLPSQDFTTKFALRLLQNQPQIQQQQQQQQQIQQQQQHQQQQQKERKQRQKQHIDKKENNDKQRGNVKCPWRLGAQRDPRFQPEWRAASEQDYDSSKMQQLLRKRRRSGGKGTRIIYERKFLIQCRQSPLAKTPPANLPHIPGVTTKDSDAVSPRENGTILEEPEKTEAEDEQFEMDL